MNRHRILVVVALALSAGSTLAGLAIVALSLGLPIPVAWGFRAFPAVFAVTFTWVGAAIAWRRPGNAIGWLLIYIGTWSGMQVLLTEYSAIGVIGQPTPLPFAVAAGWIVSWMWVVEATLASVFLLLLFPDGHFLSRRWRAVGWLGAASAATCAFGLGFNAGPLNNAPWADNPFSLFADANVRIFLAGSILLAVASFAASASLFARYRRSHGVERQQLKWLAFEAILLATSVLTASVLYQNNRIASAFMISAVALAPVMVGIAVLRYRLYDIDVLINRALVYGATSAAIGAAFFLAIVVLQAVLRPLTGGSELAVAASTLLCFALFQPVRRRVRATVDRRFYRSRYDAALTLDRFTEDLAGEVDLGAVRASLLEAVGETLQPSHAAVWLRERGAMTAAGRRSRG